MTELPKRQRIPLYTDVTNAVLMMCFLAKLDSLFSYLQQVELEAVSLCLDKLD